MKYVEKKSVLQKTSTTEVTTPNIKTQPVVTPVTTIMSQYVTQVEQHRLSSDGRPLFGSTTAQTQGGSQTIQGSEAKC